MGYGLRPGGEQGQVLARRGGLLLFLISSLVVGAHRSRGGVGSGVGVGRGCTSRVFCDRGRASGRPCCLQHFYDSAAPLGVLSLSYLPLSRLAAAAGGLRCVWLCGSTLAVEFAFTVVGWHYSMITCCEL